MSKAEDKPITQRDMILLVCEPLLGLGLSREQHGEIVDLSDHTINEMVKTLERVTDAGSSPFAVVQATIIAARLGAERLEWIGKQAKAMADGFAGIETREQFEVFEEAFKASLKPIGAAE